ncbi:uncharacterized protein TNCV_2822491 [Trichonephila clavipes]|nr:uncharacterized protein TNCV_2822491 [Trichonephila clavipes]
MSLLVLLGYGGLFINSLLPVWHSKRSEFKEQRISYLYLTLMDFSLRNSIFRWIGKEESILLQCYLHCLHKETNENGQRLWDFAVSENLFIISTAFPHKEIHKYTWISPDGQTHNQIDHVLIDRRHRNNIMDVRIYRGANVDTDHILVRSKARFRLCKNFFRKRENGNYKPDTSKLMEKNILKEHKLKLSAGIISELDSSGNDFNWKSANETVPGLERRARNEWYDEDCRKATEMKNKAYLQLLLKNCLRTHEEKNKRGELVSEPHEVTKVWKDYFQDLLEGRDEPIVLQNVHTEQDIIADEGNPPPSITEVTLAIKKLKNNRTAGPDSIPSELLKFDESELVNALHKIMVKIWETEKIPIEWEEGSVCSIFKKGDQLECRNYRGITLLNTAYKIFSNLLFARLQPYTDKVIGNYQCGFMWRLVCLLALQSGIGEMYPRQWLGPKRHPVE